jgi:hypothetical protein
LGAGRLIRATSVSGLSPAWRSRSRISTCALEAKVTPIFRPLSWAIWLIGARASRPSARPKLLGVAISLNWVAPAAIRASEDTTPVPARSMLPAITAPMRSDEVGKACHLMSRPLRAKIPLLIAR